MATLKIAFILQYDSPTIYGSWVETSKPYLLRYICNVTNYCYIYYKSVKPKSQYVEN